MMEDNSPPETIPKREAVAAGSPFAEGTVKTNPATNPIAATPSSAEMTAWQSALDTRYMACSAVVAALMVLFFAGVAAWWFPLGGTMVSLLGCGLSAFGLLSGHRVFAAVLLIMHMALFITSCSQMLP